MFPTKYAHFSVDDVLFWLKELNESSHASVFEHPAFGLFQKLHREYGSVFTMNVFYTTKDGSFSLHQMTGRFREEFQANSDWLRFSFHAFDYDSNYHHISAEEALTHYKSVCNEIVRFASFKALDTFVRIHYYSGNLEVCRALRDCPGGITGILTADDTRSAVYYLDETQRNTVFRQGFLFDETENLYCIRTFQRLDNPESPIQLLNTMELLPCLEIFWHEKTTGINRVESVCKWAAEHDYPSLFPADLI